MGRIARRVLLVLGVRRAPEPPQQVPEAPARAAAVGGLGLPQGPQERWMRRRRRRRRRRKERGEVEGVRRRFQRGVSSPEVEAEPKPSPPAVRGSRRVRPTRPAPPPAPAPGSGRPPRCALTGAFGGLLVPLPVPLGARRPRLAHFRVFAAAPRRRHAPLCLSRRRSSSRPLQAGLVWGSAPLFAFGRGALRECQRRAWHKNNRLEIPETPLPPPVPADCGPVRPRPVALMPSSCERHTPHTGPL